MLGQHMLNTIKKIKNDVETNNKIEDSQLSDFLKSYKNLYRTGFLIKWVSMAAALVVIFFPFEFMRGIETFTLMGCIFILAYGNHITSNCKKLKKSMTLLLKKIGQEVPEELLFSWKKFIVLWGTFTTICIVLGLSHHIVISACTAFPKQQWTLDNTFIEPEPYIKQYNEATPQQRTKIKEGYIFQKLTQKDIIRFTKD